MPGDAAATTASGGTGRGSCCARMSERPMLGEASRGRDRKGRCDDGGGESRGETVATTSSVGSRRSTWVRSLSGNRVQPYHDLEVHLLDQRNVLRAEVVQVEIDLVDARFDAADPGKSRVDLGKTALVLVKMGKIGAYARYARSSSTKREGPKETRCPQKSWYQPDVKMCTSRFARVTPT